MSYLTGVLHPEGYHGEGQPAPFFEGWYVKLQDAAGSTLALIPGLFRGEREQYAFVQIVDGARREVTMHHFPIAAFSAAADRFDVRIDDNRFSFEGVELALPEARAQGSIRFGALSPWPVRWRAPGAMGWYGWMPMLQCYHGIISLDHDLEGALTVAGDQREFTGGKGYIEKDWGRSFPTYHVWLQCNRFERPGDCLTVSLARIPWLGGSFQGFIIGVFARGELYRFTTYTGARVTHMHCAPPDISCTVEDRRHRLEFEARQGDTLDVLGPTGTGVNRVIDEALDGPVSYRLYRKGAGGDELLAEGSSSHGSLELQGSQSELDSLRDGRWRRDAARHRTAASS